jgi:hypothetical protein
MIVIVRLITNFKRRKGKERKIKIKNGKVSKESSLIEEINY